MSNVKFRIPRKKKKKIPVGPYCYKFLHLLKGGLGYAIKPCEFFKFIKLKDKPEKYQDEIDKAYPEGVTGWCKLVKREVDDQCKSCGTKHGY